MSQKKIYFACAITGGRDYAHTYQAIVDAIKSNGMHVLSEAFADTNISGESSVSISKGMSAAEIWEWDLNWVQESDAIVAEVSQPSLGVGYEIAIANQWHKPVLALYHKRPEKGLSAMIAGDPNVTVYEYDTTTEVAAVIKKFVQAI